MFLAALFAFAHFLTFFALASALGLQLGLISDSMTVATARRIQRADKAYGLVAVLLLVFGFLRVVYFEKGADYYFSNMFFLIKLGLFFAVGLLSIYPTLMFRRWSSSLEMDIAPQLSAQDLLRIRKIIHYELIGIMGILICASFMAKGFGMNA